LSHALLCHLTRRQVSHRLNSLLMFFWFIVETGEEGETTVFSCRAKLFHFDKQEKAWKERGVGLFKLNATATETENDYDRWSRGSDDSEGGEVEDPTSKDADNKRKARLLMRTDGVLRVVLNVPVFKGMIVGDEKGNLPSGRMVTLTALEDGKAVPLLVKVYFRVKEALRV
jgi:Ran-binding protein 3